MGSGWVPGNWMLMATLMLLLWGTVATVVVLLLRSRSASRERQANGSGIAGAEDVLNERFARGEIDEAEFSARRSALRRAP